MTESSVRHQRNQHGIMKGNYPVRSETFRIGKSRFVLVRCSCGKLKSVEISSLMGRNKCQCQRETFGASDKSHHLYHTYNSWSSMRKRVLSEKHEAHHNYGGRGISICDRWVDSFDAFYADMGKRPSKTHSLDREDNDGDYCKENCRWATQKEQDFNKRTNKLVVFRGREAPVAEHAASMGIEQTIVHKRLNRGWGVDAALTYPRYPRTSHKSPPQEEYYPTGN